MGSSVCIFMLRRMFLKMFNDFWTQFIINWWASHFACQSLMIKLLKHSTKQSYGVRSQLINKVKSPQKMQRHQRSSCHHQSSGRQDSWTCFYRLWTTPYRAKAGRRVLWVFLMECKRQVTGAANQLPLRSKERLGDLKYIFSPVYTTQVCKCRDTTPDFLTLL